MSTEIVVTIAHVREAGLCSRGAKMWFERNQLDFRHFLQHGYPVSVIEETGDALGLLVAKVARDEHGDAA